MKKVKKVTIDDVDVNYTHVYTPTSHTFKLSIVQRVKALCTGNLSIGLNIYLNDNKVTFIKGIVD